MKKIIIFSPKHGKKEVLVDDEDFDYINSFKWHLKKHRNTFYACRTKGDKRKDHFKMHRVIMKITDPDIQIDHKDHNGLNNQKSNLRKATHRQNKYNTLPRKNCTSKYLGVSLHIGKYKNSEYKRWVMHIRINDKVKSASFPYTLEGEILAAQAYDELAKQYRGEFANLNFKK